MAYSSEICILLLDSGALGR